MAFILANGKQQYLDDSGNPLNGGKLWTMQPGPGVTTPKATWTDAAETTLNANPIILNARGEAQVFWSGSYNVRLETAAGGLIYTVESIEAVSGSGGTPYIASIQTITAVAAQTLFVLTPTYQFGLAAAVIVSVNGLQYEYTVDFSHAGANSILFVTPFVGGERVTFLILPPIVGGVSLTSVTRGLAQDNAAISIDPQGGSFRIRRRTSYSGGSPSNVNAALFVDTFVEGAAGPGSPSTAATNEWALVAVMNNYSSAGENVAGYFQGIKNAGASPTWGAVIEAIDNGAGNPATGVVALEIDISANGTDSSNNKLGIYMTSRRQNPAGAANVSGYGIKLDNDAGSSYTVGIDFASATFGICAMRLAQGQTIAFNAAGTRQLVYNGGGLNFRNPIGPITYWSFNDDGSLTGLGSVQLLGTRRPGWTTVPTGTVSRLTFDESTVTLAELAQRVAALIIDFHSTTGHGLIGA